MKTEMFNANLKPTWWNIIVSGLAALIGVQSEKARIRDFSQNKVWPYILVGIVLTTLFILAIVIIARFAENYFAAG